MPAYMGRSSTGGNWPKSSNKNNRSSTERLLLQLHFGIDSAVWTVLPLISKAATPVGASTSSGVLVSLPAISWSMFRIAMMSCLLQKIISICEIRIIIMLFAIIKPIMVLIHIAGSQVRWTLYGCIWSYLRENHPIDKSLESLLISSINKTIIQCWSYSFDHPIFSVCCSIFLCRTWWRAFTRSTEVLDV